MRKNLREGEAELLGLGEEVCLLDATEDLALLKLLDHFHAHLLGALREEPRPVPELLPNLVVPIHLESKMGLGFVIYDIRDQKLALRMSLGRGTQDTSFLGAMARMLRGLLSEEQGGAAERIVGGGGYR